MKYLDEYRDGAAAEKLAAAIARTVTRPWTIMEVCGGQTHTIVKYGIDTILPPGVELVHGPGCPVCVTSLEMIDRAHAIASRPDVIFCSFGDMLRVPGSRGDLLELKSQGSDVRIVYSPLDAVNLAAANPDRQVVFFAIGFETTAPPNAMAVWMARRRQLANFSVLVSHVLVPPMITAILQAPGNRVQGFLGPGHVCTVMGCHEYEPIARRYRVPIVITGFEPLDLLEGVLRTLQQLEAGRAEVENPYARAVRHEGNPASRRLIDDVFEVCDRKWRGVGLIPKSGYKLRYEYRDARCRAALRGRRHRDPGVVALHQRADPQGAEEAARLPGVRPGVHPADAARRHHGVVGGGLRSLLRLWPPSGGAPGQRGRPGARRCACACARVRADPGRRKPLMATQTVELASLHDAIQRKCRESVATKTQFFDANAEPIVACATAMARAFDAGGRLFVMGNGGSSCDASHVAVEFMHPIIEKRPPLPALALTTDTALLTAVGNDQDFAVAFVEQLRMLGRAGDMALGISTSGKSANVNRALTMARGGSAGRRLLGTRRRPDARALRLLLHGAELQHPPDPGDARDAPAHPLGPDSRDPRRGGCHLTSVTP